MLRVYIPTGLINYAADKVLRCNSASERSRGFPPYSMIYARLSDSRDTRFFAPKCVVNITIDQSYNMDSPCPILRLKISSIQDLDSLPMRGRDLP